MTNNFLRIASLVAKQDLAKIISRTTTKKTKLMNVLQWNETIKAYNDKKLRKYSDVGTSCYWKDMTYSEYKLERKNYNNGFAKKKAKFSKEFEFLNVKIDSTDPAFDNVNVRVCIDEKRYSEINGEGVEFYEKANVEFEVVFEEYAQINNRLADLLSKKLNIDAEICSSLLMNDSFYGLCNYFTKNAKQYSNSNFSFSIENDGSYVRFVFKIDNARFEIMILDVVAKAQEDELKMIKSKNDRISDIGSLVEGIDLAKEKLKEINSVYDKVIGNGFDIGFEINNYIDGYNYNKTSLQNAITKGKFVDYFVDTVLNLRTIHEYAFNEYISACNDYFELKEISPKYYKEEVFNNAMEQYQKYKEEYDDVLIASRKRINDIREYIGNYYNKDTQCKKMILEIALNSTKSMWINRARKKIMNDFKDFKKFCEVYIEFVKKYFNEAMVIKAEQEIAEAIN